jgi:cytochrome c-type biogenesis protein CcmH
MMRRLLQVVVVAALAFAAVPAGPAMAVMPGERLADPALEARARGLSQKLRCLVFQNQSIDDSNAALAADLRVLVRERLAAGDSDDQVIDYLVDRYGDFVLLDPPMRPRTWALWYGPAVVLGLGAVGVGVFLARRRRTVAPAAPLSADEQAELAALLDDRDREAGR